MNPDPDLLIGPLKGAPIQGIRDLITFVGDDPDREGMIDTPKRFIKAMQELTSGYMEDPKKHLVKEFSLADGSHGCSVYNGIILSGGLNYVSVCEHHMLPFEGTVHIGYIPGSEDKNSRIVGLSKLARMMDGYARRFQVQERFTKQMSDAMTEVLKPVASAVIVTGRHTCQCFRGIKKDGFMVTSSMTGAFYEDASARMEFFKLIELGQHGR